MRTSALRICTLLFCVAAAAAEPRPDQMQPVVSGYTSLNGDYSVGQSFVPGKPELRRVRIYLNAPESGKNTQSVRLSVRESAFDGRELGRAELPAGAVDARGGYYAFDFPSVLRLTPGRKYVFRLEYDVPEAEKLTLPAASDYFHDLYPSGDLITAWKSAPPQIRQGQDLAFKTYSDLSGTEPEVPERPFRALLNVDYSDNFVYAGKNSFGSRDPREEIRETLENARANGFDGVNWRVSFMGEALYRSRIANVIGERFGDKGYGWVGTDAAMRNLVRAVQAADPLAIAVAEGRRLGLKVYAWVTLNDMGTNQERLDGFLGRNPHYQWVSRDGKRHLSGTPCYAEPEMRRYMLTLLRELMEYGVDGLYVSTRGHTTAFRRPTLLEYGFNPPVLNAYRERYGIDLQKSFDEARDGDRLIRLRAELENELYRELKQLRDREFPQVEILADLSQLPQDYAAWVREKLVDAITVNTVSGSEGNLPSGDEYRDIADFYRSRIDAMGGSVQVVPWLQVYSYRLKYQQEREEITRNLKALRRSGADGVIFHEHCAALSEPEKFWSFIRRGLDRSL